MSTDADALLAAIRDTMDKHGLRQQDVAAECGITQGHLSKALRKEIPLGRKTEAAFRRWLEETSRRRTPDTDEEIRRLVDGLIAKPAPTKMQIMQLLKLLNAIL